MKEKLQNRREFFKEATARALPVLGLAFIAPTPFLTSCTKEPVGCGNSCSGECAGTCSETCTGSSNSSGCSGCSSTCSSECSGSSTGSGCSSCGNNCSSGCSTSCGNNCTNNCENSCGDNCSNSSNNTPNNNISEASGSIDGHDYVDLGLSVKWARCNLNASNPQQVGLKRKNPINYLQENEVVQLLVSLGYWNTSGDKEFAGIEQMDFVTQEWGSRWYTPSKTEWKELKDNCNYEEYELEGVSGVKLTSRINGRSIFIPLQHQVSNNQEYIISQLMSSTFGGGSHDAYPYQYVAEIYAGLSYNGGSMVFIFSNISGSFAYLRGVTTGSNEPTNCNSGCTNTATNSCSSCQIGCSTGCTQQCSSNCSTGCKTDCTNNCPNGCNSLCGGACQYSCGGTCSYISAGTSCTSGTCARTCSNYCYHTCTMACSQNCISCCIISSK